jgi:hypothetical protein
MSDSEVREILISIAEIVKTEFHTERAKQDLFYREYPGAREQLAVLLERLQKA